MQEITLSRFQCPFSFPYPNDRMQSYDARPQEWISGKEFLSGQNEWNLCLAWNSLAVAKYYYEVNGEIFESPVGGRMIETG